MESMAVVRFKSRHGMPPWRPVVGLYTSENPFLVFSQIVPLSISTMSQYYETSSVSNYQLIFDNALATYEKKTGKNLASDPLLRRLESCRSPDAVIAILREQILGFDQSGGGNDRLSNWLNPTVKVLYKFSSAIGEAFSLVSLIEVKVIHTILAV